MTTTVVHEHTIKIVNMESLEEHYWELRTPFPLPLTDTQLTSIMDMVISALPAPTTHGFRVAAIVRSTSTTVDTTSRTLGPITVPGAPA
ncbi:hypothetical protein [Streptomyces sp. CAU 1734]|uniref:hypothetical protein n=1 Tax=Streptomyces sp. CAU 1734 TaxID=3140360 RepID=UPI003260EFCE